MVEHASLEKLGGHPHARPFDPGEPSVVRLSLDEDERVDPHKHPDRQIVLYLINGALDVDIADETYQIESGDIVRFDGDQEISPYARESSEALIVLARQPEE